MPRPEGLRLIDPTYKSGAHNIHEIPFPQDSEARAEAIFTALGNSEARCATLLILTPYPQSATQINREFLRVSNRAWVSRSPTRVGELETFIRTGLVEEVDIESQDTGKTVKGYSRTEEGELVGPPVASYLLETSSRLPFPLIEAFGASPVVRAKILEYLAESDDNYSNDTAIAAFAGVGIGNVGDHLRYLSQLGLVEYSSVGLETAGEIKYSLVKEPKKDDVKAVQERGRLTKIVVDIAFDLGIVDIHSVLAELKRRHPERDRVLPNNVAAILADLARQGILKRDIGDNQVKSKAKITALGKTYSEPFVAIRKAVGPDGEELLSQWRQIPWPSYTEEGVARHREKSRHVNSKSVEENLLVLFHTISSNPGIRQIEIKQRMKRNVSDLIKILFEEGKIMKVRLGKAVRYFPAETYEEDFTSTDA